MENLSALFIGILSSLIVAALLKYKYFFELLPKSTKRGYLIDLEKKIRQMPFIYKDLDTDLINDFVDVEFQNLDLGTLQLKTASNTLILDENEKLKRNVKLLFLGSAGIGKTTFQRRTILTIINNKSNSRFLYAREKPIPLYIPLKAIDNSEPFPIYRYIKNNNPLFANRFGLRRLIKFARAKRLFLFIDGYDEIPFTGGTRNFVQEELGMLFGVVKSENNIQYEALANCRVWLSSRKEFFEKNPIASLGSKSHIRKEGIAGIELKGIGNNRIKLVRKIFDKYRTRSEEYYEFLNEEYFLSEIDSSDNEIKTLSYNPLFLTVMCYIYAQKAVDERNHKVEWARKFDELILECIALLLNDLDENKARDLPKAHKVALVARRNPFVEEKKLFLQYFSIQLYFDDKPVFTIAYLKQQLRDFFEVELSSPASSIILQNLDTHDTSRPDIALQLIYQGVFVLVDTSREEVLYDFPHRRFREVLASKYINTPERYERLLANSQGKQFGEFLTVFFKSEIYSDLNFHNDTLTLILNKALGHVSDNSFVSITLQFIELKPSYYNPSNIVARFLTDAVLFDKHFEVSEKLLENYEPKNDFISNIKTELENSCKTLNYNRFYICAAILSFYYPALLVDLLKPLISIFLHNRTILPIIFQNLSLLSISNISSYVRMLDKDDAAYLDFCYAISFNLQEDKYWLQFVEGDHCDFLSQLDRQRLIIFFYFIYKYCPNRYKPLQKEVNFLIKQELFEYVEYHHTITAIDNLRIDDACIISRDTMDNILHLLKNRTTAFLLNKIFEYKERDNDSGQIVTRRETRYAVIPITKDFVENIANSIEAIKFKIIDQIELEFFVSNSINNPITKLIPTNPAYVKFADLPKHIRSSKVRDQTEATFQSDLQAILEKDTFHKYRDIEEVGKIIKEIKYNPMQLIKHFR